MEEEINTLIGFWTSILIANIYIASNKNLIGIDWLIAAVIIILIH
jgi:hypothetical protein